MNVDVYMAKRTTPRAAARRARRGVGLAHRGLRHVEDAVGRHQPLPAAERRHRASRSTTPAPSIPVGFTSSRWGSLASFGARAYADTKKWYGTSGNSFVAVVEFGDSVRARAVTAGGESGDPKSKHFNDQAERYATGNLRDVYFYPNQLKGHIERQYSPGK